MPECLSTAQTKRQVKGDTLYIFIINRTSCREGEGIQLQGALFCLTFWRPSMPVTSFAASTKVSIADSNVVNNVHRHLLSPQVCE